MMQTATTIPPSSKEAFTPSEVVLMQWMSDANQKRSIGLANMLKAGFAHRKRRLVANMLKAALLAHEQAGVIRLEIEEKKRLGMLSSNSLVVVPTGKEMEWPQATLEARLLLQRRDSVSHIVEHWLREASFNPWKRATEQGKIMLVLRGLADVNVGKWSRKYVLATDASKAISQTSGEPAGSLLENCRENRPEVWKLLDKEIEKAVKGRTFSTGEGGPAADENEKDPWFDEKVTDQEKFDVHRNLWWNYEWWPEWISYLVMFGTLLLINFGMWKWDLPYLFKFIFGLPLVLFPLGALHGWLKNKAAATITAKVKGGGAPSPQLSSARTDQETSTTSVSKSMDFQTVKPDVAKIMPPVEQVSGPPNAAIPSVERPPGRGPLSFALEVVTADNLPPVSDESRRRVADVWHRGPLIRQAYRKGIRLLAGSTTLLALGYSPLGQYWTGVVLLAIPLVVTLVALRGPISSMDVGSRSTFVEKGSGISRSNPNGSSTVRQVEISLPTTCRPTGWFLLGGIWVILALLHALACSLVKPQPQGSLFFSVAFLSCALGYLYWINQTARAIERCHPYQAPLNLLALRVFGSSYLADFLNLIMNWQWIGTRQMLNGEDTAGQKMSDLKNYFTGHIENSIINSPKELQEELGQFRTQADRQLRFPVNSIQCTDATWKEALQHLFDAADVVVMDLTDLTEERRGVAYELGEILDQIPLQRFIPLINDSTDRKVLDEILTHAWENMAADSPNRVTVEPRLRLYHMGGSSERKPEESLHDWEHRQNHRCDERHLVCLLYDAAQPPRIPATIDPKRDRASIQWSSPITSALAWFGNSTKMVVKKIRQTWGGNAVSDLASTH